MIHLHQCFAKACGFVGHAHCLFGTHALRSGRLSVRWRPARQRFTFTRSVLAGLWFPALWFKASSLALAGVRLRAHGLFFSQVGFSHLFAAVPNRSFNRTQNGVCRFVPSLALGAG